jgi:hypothetical protein
MAMNNRVFKVHTDQFGRLEACIKKAMYGVSKKAFTKELPKEFINISLGDIVFISEKEVSHNALFGPFYVTDSRAGITGKNIGKWLEIDTYQSDRNELAYWVEMEKRYYCLLFDLTLIDKISIIWPQDWSRLQLKLPAWGLVEENEAKKLVDFAVNHEQDVMEFLKRHSCQ